MLDSNNVLKKPAKLVFKMANKQISLPYDKNTYIWDTLANIFRCRLLHCSNITSWLLGEIKTKFQLICYTSVLINQYIQVYTQIVDACFGCNKSCSGPLSRITASKWAWLRNTVIMNNNKTNKNNPRDYRLVVK